jgi:hypothetical protein
MQLVMGEEMKGTVQHVYMTILETYRLSHETPF